MSEAAEDTTTPTTPTTVVIKQAASGIGEPKSKIDRLLKARGEGIFWDGFAAMAALYVGVALGIKKVSAQQASMLRHAIDKGIPTVRSIEHHELDAKFPSADVENAVVDKTTDEDKRKAESVALLHAVIAKLSENAKQSIDRPGLVLIRRGDPDAG